MGLVTLVATPTVLYVHAPRPSPVPAPAAPPCGRWWYQSCSCVSRRGLGLAVVLRASGVPDVAAVPSLGDRVPPHPTASGTMDCGRCSVTSVAVVAATACAGVCCDMAASSRCCCCCQSDHAEAVDCGEAVVVLLLLSPRLSRGRFKARSLGWVLVLLLLPLPPVPPRSAPPAACAISCPSGGTTCGAGGGCGGAGGGGAGGGGGAITAGAAMRL